MRRKVGQLKNGELPNKELKLTELRSLTPVLGSSLGREGTVAIQRMTVCEWLGTSARTQEVEDPSWAAVEAAIRALDNASRNDLYLIPEKASPETYLCIGGGAGRYVVTGAIRNETFPTAVHPGKPSEPLESLVVGGQVGQYPANWILDLANTLRVAEQFHATGRFEGDATWVDA